MDDTETFEDLLEAYIECIGENHTWHCEATEEALRDYVARLEANQITPDMLAVWQAYQSEKGDRPWYYITHDKMEQYKDVLWAAFANMMDGGE